MAYVFLVSLVLIMVGELADKSQLLALCLATRYKAWQVIVGIFAATFVVHFFTTLAGQTLGAFIPASILPWLTGLLFVGFGLWTLKGDAIDDAEADRGRGRFGPILATFVAFFLAELGDKTQIMTMTIAADPGSALLAYLHSAGPAVKGWLDSTGLTLEGITPMGQFWGVTLGSTVGMVVADAVAIAVGSMMGARLPELALRRVSGVVFILFGIATVLAPYLAGRAG